MNNKEHIQVVGKPNRSISRFIFSICRIDNAYKRIEEYFTGFLERNTVLLQIRRGFIAVPLKNLALVQVLRIHSRYIQRIYTKVQAKLHLNKNAFVRNSSICSRNPAAFSNRRRTQARLRIPSHCVIFAW